MLDVDRHRAVRATHEQVGNTPLIHRELEANRHLVEFGKRRLVFRHQRFVLVADIAPEQDLRERLLFCGSAKREGAFAAHAGHTGGRHFRRGIHAAAHQAGSALAGKVANRGRKSRPFDRGVLSDEHLLDALDRRFANVVRIVAVRLRNDADQRLVNPKGLLRVPDFNRFRMRRRGFPRWKRVYLWIRPVDVTDDATTLFVGREPRENLLRP